MLYMNCYIQKYIEYRLVKTKGLNITIYYYNTWRYKMKHDKNTNRLRRGRRQNCRDLQVGKQIKYEARSN